MNRKFHINEIRDTGSFVSILSKSDIVNANRGEMRAPQKIHNYILRYFNH